MATTTPFLNLRKPAVTGGVSGQGDPVNAIADISDNMDKIDTFASDTDSRLDGVQALGEDASDSGTVTSFTYTQTRTGATSPVGLSFVAPDSGIVIIAISAGINHNTANDQFMLCSPAVRTGNTIGSGGAFFGPTDTVSLQYTGTAVLQASRVKRLEGLTPGNNYNIVLEFRVFSGTATFARVEVDIIPSL
jgi:hypothetical protein